VAHPLVAERLQLRGCRRRAPALRQPLGTNLVHQSFIERACNQNVGFQWRAAEVDEDFQRGQSRAKIRGEKFGVGALFFA